MRPATRMFPGLQASFTGLQCGAAGRIAAVPKFGCVHMRMSSTAAASGKHPEVTLYQYEVCPYCTKVRTYLDFQGVPYKKVEVNPMSKKEIKFSKDYQKVPISIVDGEQINDSSKIIDAVTAKLEAAGLSRAASKDVSQEDVSRWRVWLDEKLIKALPPNIYRTLPEAIGSFGYISKVTNFSLFERIYSRYGGAVVMYLVSKKMRTKYNIPEGKERDTLYNYIDHWVDRAVGNKMYFGGETPAVLDVEVFGVIDSIRYTKAWTDLMANTKVKPWYERMEQQVKAGKQ